MSLPEQIQKQVEQAQSIIEQHYGPDNGGGDTAKLGGESPTTPETPAGENAQAAATAESVVPDSAPAPAKPPVEDENSETYAARWRSLQGIYQATSLKAQAAEQRAQQLEQLIATMQASPSHQNAQQPSGFLTEDDLTSYGEDLVGMARRAAKEEIREVMGAIEALRVEIGQLRSVVPMVNRVMATQQLTAEEKFFADLGRLVPDYEQINANANFRSWLLAPDPLTMITRQTYLEDAQRSGDVGRVANIFTAWKELSGHASPAGGAAAPTPTPQTASATQRELLKQVVPGKTVAAVTPVTQQARTWSPQDIAQFYDEVRRGVYRGREQERASLEHDIFLAQREGRIARNAA